MRLPLPVVRAAVFAGSRPLGQPVPVPVQRAWLELSARVNVLPDGTTVETTTLAGRRAERVSAPGADEGAALLLLHGGAFLTCSPRTHRVFAAHLAVASGAPVHVLDYRLAPEHPYPAAVDDADRAFVELAGRARTAVVGDSAGGALALLLAQRLRDDGRPQPRALALVSPVVDLTGATSDAYRGPEPVLRASWVRSGCAAFVGAGDARTLSPLRRGLAGLAPALVHLASDERLRPEGEALVAGMAAAGTTVQSETLDGLWHDVHLQSHLVPAAAAATARMGRWLAGHLAA